MVKFKTQWNGWNMILQGYQMALKLSRLSSFAYFIQYFIKRFPSLSYKNQTQAMLFFGGEHCNILELAIFSPSVWCSKWPAGVAGVHQSK